MSDDLEEWLRRTCHTASGPYLRPFAANARWRSARVFLVGTNPSTPLRDEFDSFDAYWQALTADTAAFDAAYRHANRLKAGQRTKTSINADRIVDQLGDIPVLRTNAYAYPSRKPAEIPDVREQEALGRRIFARLLEGIAPRVVIAHGREAEALLKRVTRLPLDRAKPVDRQEHTFRPDGKADPVHVFVLPHLSGAGAPAGYSFAPVYGSLPSMIRELVQ